MLADTVCDRLELADTLTDRDGERLPVSVAELRRDALMQALSLRAPLGPVLTLAEKDALLLGRDKNGDALCGALPNRVALGVAPFADADATGEVELEAAGLTDTDALGEGLSLAVTGAEAVAPTGDPDTLPEGDNEPPGVAVWLKELLDDGDAAEDELCTGDADTQALTVDDAAGEELGASVADPHPLAEFGASVADAHPLAVPEPLADDTRVRNDVAVEDETVERPARGSAATRMSARRRRLPVCTICKRLRPSTGTNCLNCTQLPIKTATHL